MIAYIVGVFNEAPLLKKYLSQTLPDYMIPSYFVPLEHLPLTPSGKIDRRALPAPRLKAGENYIAPRDELERKLAGIWTAVLSVDGDIGIGDNFFDQGGHSIKAMTLVSMIRKEFNVEFSLSRLFKNPCISAAGDFIREARKRVYEDILPVEKREYYPLSSAQKRIYFLQQLDLNSTVYNMPVVIPLGEDVDESRLAAAFRELIARHESLRTSFEMVNGEPVQRVHEDVDFRFEPYLPPLSSTPLPFDLSRAPLIRSGLLPLPGTKRLWVVDMHHIISDGTSTVILIEEFLALYAGHELPGLTLQYKDFAQWQNRLFAGGGIRSQEQYWLDFYSGEIPRLELPADFKRPGVFTFAGSNYRFRLEGETAAKFKTLGLENGATLYMNILAVLDTLFYKYTGQTDIIIGSGIAGRNH
ncbi:MAG: non-ribosomal peptide synthetase, partial [bacterium]|nr:non-ribosomal peptide synthetase [bacterium]